MGRRSRERHRAKQDLLDNHQQAQARGAQAGDAGSGQGGGRTTPGTGAKAGVGAKAGTGSTAGADAKTGSGAKAGSGAKTGSGTKAGGWSKAGGGAGTGGGAKAGTGAGAGGSRARYQPPRQDAVRAMVDRLLDVAIYAQHQEDDATISRSVQSLVETPGGAVGRRVVNRAVMDHFEQAVARAWERGWQPADLARVLRRDVGGRAVRMAVDAMAGRMRQYASATVDERWEAQLTALDADVWWADDGAWLEAWGDREDLDRAAVLRMAIEVLHTVDCLPGMPRLMPLPGAARRGSLHRGRAAGSTVDPRLLDRVQGLLAKAESTDFAEEAEALTAKAQELMARHSIDYALLASESGTREEPVGRRVGIDNPYEASKALLLDKVAGANRCRAVWNKAFGFSAVVGFESDLDAVELLYTSLLVQATTAMLRAGSRQDRYGRSRTRSFRQSFLTSFGVRIGERLMAAADDVGKQAAAEVGDSRLLPVLAARENAVRDAAEAMHPDADFHAVRAGDREGWVSGRTAADMASLNVREQVRNASPG